MTRPTPLGLEAQRELHRQITDLLVAHAPPDRDQIRVLYRAAGRHEEMVGHILGLDGQLREWAPPPALAEPFRQLRAGAYRDGVGTWSAASTIVEQSLRTSITYLFQEDPRWRQLPPRTAVLDELEMYPRTAEHVPAWMTAVLPHAARVAEVVGRFRHARIFDHRDAGGRPVVERPPVPEAERDWLLNYLNTAPVILGGRGFDPDLFDPGSPPDVPAGYHTDGTWIWTASVPHYLAKHGVPPEPDLVAHARARGFSPPPVDQPTRDAAYLALTGELASHPAPSPAPASPSPAAPVAAAPPSPPAPLVPPDPAVSLDPVRAPAMLGDPAPPPAPAPAAPVASPAPPPPDLAGAPASAPPTEAPAPVVPAPAPAASPAPAVPPSPDPVAGPASAVPLADPLASPDPAVPPDLVAGEPAGSASGPGGVSSPVVPVAGEPAGSAPALAAVSAADGADPADAPVVGPAGLSERDRRVLAFIERRVSEAGAISEAYRILGSAEGATCLERVGDAWQVAAYERGQPRNPQRFAQLWDAGAYLLGTLALIPSGLRAGGGDRDTARALNDWPVQPLPQEPPLTLLAGKHIAVLMPGRELVRYGPPTGNLTFAAGTAFPAMSLRPEKEQQGPARYRVVREIRALAGETVPWHDQPGGGAAYLLPRAVQDHVADGSLADLSAGAGPGPGPEAP